MIEIVKLGIVFVLVIILIRKIDIGLTMVIASATLAVLFLIKPHQFAIIAYNSLIAGSTLNLVFALFLIMLLAGFMKKEGMMQKMVGALQAVVKDARVVMAMLPAIIGFIPIPGGALFTCSLVEEAESGLNLSAGKKSYINFWYRHVWEFVLPLYPGTLLTLEIFNISYPKFVENSYPMTLLAILIGIPIAFRNLSKEVLREKRKTTREKRHIFDLLNGIRPVFLTVFIFFVARLPLSICLAIVVIDLFVIYRYSFGEIFSLVKESFTYKPISLVFGVILFKNVLIDSGGVESLATFFTSRNLPILPAFYILPFFVGLLTGNVTGVVGATFPILLGLMPKGEVDINLAILAFTSGFAGVMASPVHLCLVLTVQYFRAKLEKVIFRIAISEAAIVLLATALYFLNGAD